MAENYNSELAPYNAKYLVTKDNCLCELSTSVNIKLVVYYAKNMFACSYVYLMIL